MNLGEETNSRKYAVASIEIKPYLQEWIERGHPLYIIANSSVVSESVLKAIIRDKTKYTTGSVAQRLQTALEIGLGKPISFTFVSNPLYGYGELQISEDL